VWYGQNLDECVENWLTNKEMSKSLPLITRWYVWKERNHAIFERKVPSTITVARKIIGNLRKKKEENRPLLLRIFFFSRFPGYTVAFFDGAASAVGSLCGAGGTLRCSNYIDYSWFLNCGEGTNTKAELMGEWATLMLARHLNI
jgi:hypothetical protein